MSTSARFTCEACGKQYPWKPELAGRKAKCKCGHVMAVPVEAPVDDGLLDLAPEPVSTQPARAVTVAPAAGHPTAAAGGPARGSVAPPSVPTSVRPPAESTSLEALAARHGLPRPVRQTGATSSSLSSGQIVMIVVAVVVLVGGAVTAKFLLSGQSKPKVPALGDDAEVQASIDDKNGKDLADWLNSANTRRMLLRMPMKEQALEWAGYVKKMGAVRVWAWGEVPLIRVAVELPQDPEKRKVIFDYEMEWNSKPIPTKDVGQRYLYFDMMG